MMSKIALAMAIGLLAGVVGALCGVGGGIVMVPAFVGLLGMDQKHAVATSLAVVVPTALAASINYARSGLIEWNIWWPAAAGGIVAAVFASEWMKALSNLALTRIFAVVLIVIGIQMLVSKPA
ncbi:hypothetical protein BH23VER1_BH23VER1_25950 [soil metagenome]